MYTIVGIYINVPSESVVFKRATSSTEIAPDTEGLAVAFQLTQSLSIERADQYLRNTMPPQRLLRALREGWQICLNELTKVVPDWKVPLWLHGSPTATVKVIRQSEFNCIAYLAVTRKEIEMSNYTRIFLSHKGVDKPVVRRIENVLRILGFDTWLDESALNAGAELERGLLAGMKASCAAVFFITADYYDENYLATEVDYAVAEKRRKGDKFSIVTLVLASHGGRKESVPELLKRYVWKEPKSESEMLAEILRAIPLRTEIVWKQ